MLDFFSNSHGIWGRVEDNNETSDKCVFQEIIGDLAIGKWPEMRKEPRIYSILALNTHIKVLHELYYKNFEEKELLKIHESLIR